MKAKIINEFLWQLGLACKVKEILYGRLVEVYKVWQYENVDDTTNRNIDYILDRMYRNITNKILKTLLNEIRYRNNKESYCKVKRKIRKFLGITQYKKTKSQILEESNLEMKIRHEEKLKSIINKHHERLHKEVYKDGIFRINYYDLLGEIDDHLKDLTIEKICQKLK